MSAMSVVTLGTGNPMPDPNRAGPCTLVRTSAANILVDCGRGALMRAAAVGVNAPQIEVLLLTHLHSDHLTDVNDLMTMRWAMTFTPTRLVIAGPEGTRHFVERTLEALSDDISYRVAHHDDLNWEPLIEIHELTAGPVPLDIPSVQISAAHTDHSPVRPTLGYRIEQDGRSVVVAGDTVPCEGLDQLCLGADVYVQTTIRPDLIEAIPVQRLRDVVDYHSSISDAAGTAARAAVGTLVMTHLVPAPPPTDEGEEPWLEEARTHFSGSVVVARDLTEIQV